MRLVFTCILIIIAIGCGTEPKYNTMVTGHIKGLQKGTLYLQKIQDTTYATLDSIAINKEQEFQLGCNLKEPEVLYLSLAKGVNAERILFFSTSGITTINTSLKRFTSDAVIVGGDQHELLEEYNATLVRFKDKELELLETSLNAQRLKNDSLLQASENQREKNLKRQYLYSINFAINNNNSEVAPYVALADVYAAKPTLLDTIYNSLSPSIAKSKYGVMLGQYIQNIKAQ